MCVCVCVCVCVGLQNLLCWRCCSVRFSGAFFILGSAIGPVITGGLSERVFSGSLVHALLSVAVSIPPLSLACMLFLYCCVPLPDSPAAAAEEGMEEDTVMLELRGAEHVAPTSLDALTVLGEDAAMLEHSSLDAPTMTLGEKRHSISNGGSV